MKTISSHLNTYTASGAYQKLLKSFPGVGVFDQLKWTYNGEFAQLFGLGRGEFEQKFSKNSNARGGFLSFDSTGPEVVHFVICKFNRTLGSPATLSSAHSENLNGTYYIKEGFCEVSLNEARLCTSTWQTNCVQRMTVNSPQISNNVYYSKKKNLKIILPPEGTE